MIVMVNPKRLILTRLREGGVISGQELARELGVSRVAVWKHIQSLVERGYGIMSTGGGYVLEEDGDFVYPWEFSNPELVHWEEETGSTMDLARERAASGAPAGTVVAAERQRAGRGRYGRRWETPPGSIAATVVWRPGVGLDRAWEVLFGAGAALAEVLREQGVPAVLHWPNDVYVEGKKVAGLLLEVLAEHTRLVWASVGIGVNVHSRPEVPEAGALDEWTGGRIRRVELLEEVIARMRLMLGEGPQVVRARWRRVCGLWGKRVVVEEHGKVVRGVAEDIGRRGELVVRTPEGQGVRVVTGVCTVEG
ncbi:biotin--[acetyl-CoA-carboxylase] ligase [Spirochaeta thermophila]|nr:biotin--[acetyl-CoA-carboxylase] ligase [Spirochaeta thermophila]